MPTTNMMTRREALRTAALGAFSLPLLSSVGQAAAAAAAPVTPARVERLRLGIASYSLRNLSLDDAIATVKTLRISNIALFKNHCAWETASVEECRAVGGKLKAAGLTLTGSGVVNLTNDEAKCRKAFENVKAAGMLTMVCKPEIDALPLVEKLVKEFDQKLAIHNHGPEDKLYPTPEVAWNAIKSLDARIGLCIDVGHTARFGDDVVTSIKKYSARLHDVHMKDSIAVVGAQKDVPIEVGAGRLDVRGMLRALIDVNYPGVVAFEYEKVAGNPVTGLAESVGYVRGLLAGMSDAPTIMKMKHPLRLTLAACLAGALAFSAAAQDTKKKQGSANAGSTKAPGKATKGEITGGLPADARTLRLGDAAPDFTLLGIDGKTHTLADYKAAKLLMVVFLSNHCPYSHASETRLIPLAKEFKAQGLDVVSINPNSPDSVRVDELGYSKYNDGYAEMKLYARDSGFPFPYLYDGDTQATAKAYGCLATPHVFLFDQERKLRYVGRVDDSRFEDPKTVTSHDTRNAVVELLAGKPVTTPKTIVMGCSTKWNTKRDDIAKAEEKWKSEAVDLELIDAAGVAKLAKNDSNRLRLVNVWATWCAPCVAEFPALVALARRVGNRDFELVTISMDDPKMQPQVKAFLEKQHVATPARLKRLLAAEGRGALNVLYTGASTDALVKALDPEWPGPLPHTVLIAPGGKILWRHNGAVDPEVLKHKVIDLLGPFYTPEEKR